MTTKRLIFVSHSHEDDAFGRCLIADLRANLGDEAVWYDVSGGLQGGDDWWNRIIAEITERPYFLVVLSPNATASKWVPEEMAIAFRQKVELGKRLLPVRLAESPRREDWKGIHEFDFTQSSDPSHYRDAFAKLLQIIDPNIPVPTISAMVNMPLSPEPERQLTPNERLAQEVHTAFAQQQWSDVLDKTEILVARGAMNPALWRERVSAAFAVGNNSAGLTITKQALKAGVEDADILLLFAQFAAKAGDDDQASEILTHAYALTSLNDTPTRLAILDELTAALARRGFEHHINAELFARRVADARRMVPNDLRWALREVEAMLVSGRYDESLAAARALPASAESSPELPAWQSAISAATRGAWDGRNWLTYNALLEAAVSDGIDAVKIAQWRFEFPHFVPLVTFTSSKSELGGTPLWSPNGAQIATNGANGTCVWDASSGHKVATLPENSWALAWSPDSSRLAISTGNGCCVWDITAARIITKFGPQSNSIGRAVGHVLGGLADGYHPTRKRPATTAWSPNGKWLVTTSNDYDTLAQMWDATSGRLLASLPGGSSISLHIPVTWSPNGELLVTTTTGYSDLVQIWSAPSGRLVATLSGALPPVAWSSDGLQLASRSGDGVQVWETFSGRLLRTIGNGNFEEIHCLAWSPGNERLAIAGSSKGSGQGSGIWEVASMQQLARFASIHLWTLAWTPDGKRLVGVDYGIPRMWNATNGYDYRDFGVNMYYGGPSDNRPSFAWAPTGTRLARLEAGTATIWEEQ